MASTQEVLAALEICEDMGVRCIYEVDQKCPYRDENYKHVCKRSQLMKDARSKIVELQNALVVMLLQRTFRT